MRTITVTLPPAGTLLSTDDVRRALADLVTDLNANPGAKVLLK